MSTEHELPQSPAAADASAAPTAGISRRKDEHLDIVLAGGVAAREVTTGFERIRFEHVALPELSLGAIDLSTEFLGRRLAAPLLISSMTGGPTRAGAINAAIAGAAQALGIGFAVGSQRIAIESSRTADSGGLDHSLRDAAPDALLLANFGAAQLKTWQAGDAARDAARRAVDMIGADGLIVHLNPLHEAVQAGGDTDWTGLLAALAALARSLPVPVVVKEVGSGISGTLARQLVDAGVAAIDVAGAGGTSWAQVEAARATTPEARAVAAAFRDWGIPTATALADVRRACPDTPVIASGGMRDGIDVAKAIRIGATLGAQAAGVLPAALAGPEALIGHLRTVIEQLRVACFCTGSRDLAALRQARLIRPPPDLI